MGDLFNDILGRRSQRYLSMTTFVVLEAEEWGVAMAVGCATRRSIDIQSRCEVRARRLLGLVGLTSGLQSSVSCSVQKIPYGPTHQVQILPTDNPDWV
jgi:hypothetical protein